MSAAKQDARHPPEIREYGLESRNFTPKLSASAFPSVDDVRSSLIQQYRKLDELRLTPHLVNKCRRVGSDRNERRAVCVHAGH
jgi:hypothetical protein